MFTRKKQHSWLELASSRSRFISTDPLGHAATPDLYSFAAGDPINVGDPTGRFNQGLSSLGYHSQGNIHRAQAAYSAGQIAAEHGGPDVNPSQVAMAKYESLSKGDPHTQAQWEANLMGYGGATVAATSLPALSVLMPAVAIELAPAVVATKTLVATKGAELIGRASSQYTLAGQHTYSHVNAIAHTQLFAIKGVSVTALGGYITFDTIDSFTTGALGSPPYSTGFESLSFGGKLLEQIGIVNPYSQAVQGFGYFAHLKSKAYNLNSQLSDSSTSFSPIGSNPISK